MAESKWIFILILVANCFLSAFSQVLLKKAALKNENYFVRQYLNPYVLLGYALFFVVLCVNVFLLKHLPLLVLNPVAEALPIALSFVAGGLFFGENLSKRKICGGILIVAGIVVVLV